MANPFDQFDNANSNPFDQFDSAKAAQLGDDLVSAGIQKPALMPDLPAELLGKLPENPAEFASKISQPDSEWVQRQYDRKKASEMGGIETFVASVGKGGINLLRGLGLMDMAQPREQQQWKAAQDARPITTMAGELTGEAIPFLIPGGAVGKIASTGGRIAASGAIGGAEAGLSARGRTGSEAEALGAGSAGVLLGAGLEAALPYVGRAVGATYRKLTGKAAPSRVLTDAGRPTPEVQQVLDEAGIDFDTLSEGALKQMQDLPPTTSPEQAARMAVFNEAEIPYTRGDITKQLPDQTAEARLSESANDPLADPFRAKRLQQSEAIRGSLESELAAGVPERAGEATKEALSSRLSQMKTERRALYESAKEQAAGAGGVDVVTDRINAAIPVADLEDLAITAPSQIKALDGILVKYGIKPAAEGVEVATTPLNIENVERFRKTLNSIERSDQTGASSVAIGPIKRALDDELELMTEAGVGIPPALRETLKQARTAVRQEKTEFSPQAIAGRLSGLKRDGVTPIIEASRVAPKLLGPSGTKEDLLRTMQTLSKAGDKGKQAIGDLQSTAILQIMDNAFDAGTRQIDGVNTFGAGAYKKAVDKIGKDKLNILFANNPTALKKINNISAVAKLIQPSGAAIPKGSAMANLEIANKLFGLGLSTKIPLVGSIVNETLGTISKNAGTRAQVNKALAAKPDQLKLAVEINRNYPALASALGIAGVGQAATEE
jgi:hypothetical protein